MTISIHALCGRDASALLSDLAALRMTVFREYPYLYEGTLANEEEYLRGYARSEQSLIVIAKDGERVVGASTAMPLLDHRDGVVPAMQGAGFDPRAVCYFGESVLYKEHRGQGIGHMFFDLREAHARKHGFAIAAFCAVQRPSDHPARPADYVPHDAFWKKRGFVPRPDIVAQMSWRDIGDEHESSKPMAFWIKELRA